MTTSQATATMVILFALRCLVPIVLMLGIGYAMNWLVDRWENEAMENEFVTLQQAPAAAATPCWSIIKCDPEVRQNCPGFKHQKVPCWLARTYAEGTLPSKCLTCPIYPAAPAPASSFA